MMSVWKHILPNNYITWDLERPAPALPNSYFWTWDHSTNWVLDDPGNQFDGCGNAYLKQPETFIEDYRRLTDFAAGLGVRGIVIWGFLRNAHLGVEGAKRVVDYAHKKGVRIYPGIGVTAYGGVYYEGDHKYNLSRYSRENPDKCSIAHPDFRNWFAESIKWLYDKTDIDGFNLENGDFLVDNSSLMKQFRKSQNWPDDDSDVFFNQAMSYIHALDSLPVAIKDTFASYATYTGFKRNEKAVQNEGMGPKPPEMINRISEDAICQWSLYSMLLRQPLKLTDYLENGTPDAVFDNPNWPRGLVPPSKRSVGFVHQGSQWFWKPQDQTWSGSRFQMVLSSIKEACLRSYLSGLEGVSIHGEVSWRNFNCALNYLAFSHFIHWPEDSMLDFGHKTLGQIFGSRQAGEDFIVALCHLESGSLTEEHRKLADPRAHGFPGSHWGNRGVYNAVDWQKCLLWVELSGRVNQALSAGRDRTEKMGNALEC